MQGPRRSLRWTLALIPAALALGQTGCAALESLQRPTARITGVKLGDIGLTSASLVFDLEVTNPYSVPLPLVDVDFALASADQPFLSGKAELQGRVPARGRRTVPLPTTVRYLELLKVLRKVRPGEVIAYEAELGLSVDAPGVGPMRLPMRKKGNLPIPAAPGLEVVEVRWDKLSLEHAGGRVRLRITNRNRFPVELARLGYTLSLGGVAVADNSIAAPVSFAADGGAGEVEIPIGFSPKDLGLAVFGMLRGKGSGYDFAGSAQLTTPFGPMRLPVKGIGRALFKR